MPLPEKNLYPHFNISRLSHIELGVKDLNASYAFYVDILGLQVTEKNNLFFFWGGVFDLIHKMSRNH